ncbi:endopeptidase [Achromobacter aloeverae]|uniref:Endopeptidase n=1 Tax=Achromobacter aloeverae TaxID=1750518 RepID=A0A4Q1HR75_9BURK|nr:endopeptidase [Achromobacter aloeverae]RXN93337.1 endopeptidase [Achromobacter aloeverae]
MLSKTLILASVLAVSLTACNKKEDTAPAAGGSTPSTTAPSTTAPSTTTPPAAGGAMTPAPSTGGTTTPAAPK